MASLISSTDRESFQKDYADFFDTFKEEVVIHKTPKKTFAAIGSKGVYGYGDNSNKANFTLTPVSGVFSGVVTYAEDQESRILGEANEYLEAGQVIIEVDEGGRNFINSGITELVQIGDQKFVMVGSERNSSFLGSPFFSFKLKKTK